MKTETQGIKSQQPANVYLVGDHNTGKTTILEKLFEVTHKGKGIKQYELEFRLPLVTDFGRGSRKKFNFTGLFIQDGND